MAAGLLLISKADGKAEDSMSQEKSTTISSLIMSRMIMTYQVIQTPNMRGVTGNENAKTHVETLD